MARPSVPTRPIYSWMDAERAAREWCRGLGWRDARLTPPGADGGVDVVAAGLVAQVKHQAVPVGVEIVQRLHGVAVASGARALCFSTSRYSRPAVEWANRVGVSLFELDAANGFCTPTSAAARDLMSKARTVVLPAATPTAVGANPMSWPGVAQVWAPPVLRSRGRASRKQHRLNKEYDSLKARVSGPAAPTAVGTSPLPRPGGAQALAPPVLRSRGRAGRKQRRLNKEINSLKARISGVEQDIARIGAKRKLRSWNRDELAKLRRRRTLLKSDLAVRQEAVETLFRARR